MSKRCLMIPSLLMTLSAQAGEQLHTAWASSVYQGDYGRDAATDTWVNQLRVNYRLHGWQFGYSQALIQQVGRQRIVDGESLDDVSDGSLDGGDPVDNLQPDQSQRSSIIARHRNGIADPSVSLSYRWPDKQSLLNKHLGSWRLAVRWKLPLTDEQAFSNGRHEGRMSLHRSQRLKWLTLNASLGYHWRENRVNKDNAQRWYSNIGLMVFPGAATGLGVSYFYKQKLESQPETARTVGINGYWRVNRRVSVTANAGVGLSRTVADHYLGASLNYRWHL